MRILIVSDVSSHMRGGVPAETRTLVNGLIRLGHEIAMACDFPLSGCEGATHFAISLPVQKTLPAEVDTALLAFKPEFVHVICMNSSGVAMLAKSLKAQRWALTAHSIPPYERKLAALHDNERLHYAARALRFIANSLAWRWVLGRQMVPSVIVHSEFVRRIAASYGCDPARIALIPLPFLDPAGGHEPAEAEAKVGSAVSLVCVGGMAHTKGQHDLVNALPALVAAHPGLRCELIGEVRDESYLQYLRDLASRLGVAQNLTFSINASNAHKAEALARADVYVQPSHEEGFCLAYAEGASVVPRVVGADTGAIRAMSENDPAMRVVPPRCPDAMATAIAEVIAVRLAPGHMAARLTRLSLASSEPAYLRAHLNLYSSA